MEILRDALAAVDSRMVREHQILHVAAALPSHDQAIDRARLEALKWAQKRCGGELPSEAMAGRSFEYWAAGRNSSAVEIDLPGIHAWALRQEDPDKQVAGRIWTSEITLWRTPNDTPRFATRLIVASSEAELDILPAAPGYIRQLIDSVGLYSGNHRLSSLPLHVDDESSVDRFSELLCNPARRLPVVALALPDDSVSSEHIAADKLAAGLCGMAQIVTVSPSAAWQLTRSLGKRLSVFDGGARIYLPGFDHSADPFSHPLWIGAQFITDQTASTAYTEIRRHIARLSVRSFRLGEDIIPFSQLRSMGRKAEQDRLASSGANASEKLSAAENRIAALEKELNEAKEMERFALDEERKADVRAREAESRERNATARVQTLIQRLSDLSKDTGDSLLLPDDWEDFEDWCEDRLVGQLVLAPPARRGCKKPLFNDVKQAARCLHWLATICRTRFMQGGGSLRDELVENGVRNALCGDDEFAFDWSGQRLTAKWHIKNGGNTRSPENCLRIYYGWDTTTQQIVVADMPGHRHTGAT